MKWYASGFSASPPAAEKPLGAQDALMLTHMEGRVIAAVADGHGDRRHLRSRRGAEFACDVWAELALTVFGPSSPSARADDQHRIDALLPREFARQWIARVEMDFLERRPHRRELQALGISSDDWTAQYGDAESEQQGDAKRSRVRLYGTTFLGVVARDDGLLACQIGDGLITLLNEDLGFHVLANSDAASAPGDLTESLASQGAEHSFRTEVHWEGLRGPCLVALVTDGVEKAYASVDPLQRQLEVIYSAARNCGPDSLESFLASTAADFATAGCRVSGDDASVVLLYGQTVS